MTSKILSFHVLLFSVLLLTMMPAVSVCAAGQKGSSTPGAAQQAAADVRGTWSGTLFSKHANMPAFTITIVIASDSRGHLVGTSSLNSNCLKGAQLQVAVTGSNLVLAGSDEEGDNITVRGTVDKTGTLLNATYILNGSATGKCETDDGAGSLAKR
ncbi:MAG TPA: hypothetical protein VJQ82_19500 [Terriglobales bacterium]|nr:hypothetical protein [Terriglobales bacterium]